MKCTAKCKLWNAFRNERDGITTRLNFVSIGDQCRLEKKRRVRERAYFQNLRSLRHSSNVISHARKDLTGRKRRDSAESDRLHGNASRAVRTREPWLHSYSNDIVHEVRCW